MIKTLRKIVGALGLALVLLGCSRFFSPAPCRSQSEAGSAAGTCREPFALRRTAGAEGSSTAS